LAKFYFVTVILSFVLGILVREWWPEFTKGRILLILFICFLIVINEKSTGLFERWFRKVFD